jgi:hypothetical protein
VIDDGTPSVESTTCQESSAGSSAAGRGPRILSEEIIKAHLHDIYDDLDSNKSHKIPDIWRALYEKYHTPRYVLIRPSGNPLTSEGFVHMHCSQDVEVIGMILISVDSIQLIAGGAAAVATYTVDQKFTYKGTLNEDRCVVTCVLEEYNGDIKIGHEHRTTGQPIPKQTRWNAV